MSLFESQSVNKPEPTKAKNPGLNLRRISEVDAQNVMTVVSEPALQMGGNSDSADDNFTIRPANANIQIQKEESTAETTEAENRDLDAELDALLNGIVVDTPNIPAFEAITSTTAGEYSRGELESEIQRLWQREHMSFTQAARHAASENTIGQRGPQATQSAHIEPEVPYSQRWSVNLFAYDYRTGADLPEINNLTRRGSPFQRSLAAEFDRVIPVRNPTGREIYSEIFNGIHNLWLALDEGQIGEIVVTFSGHGGNGFISGIDWESISPNQLSGLADLAEEFNIHMVYILDTCRAGLLANYAQADATTDIAEQIANAPGDRQQELSADLESTTALGTLTARVSGHTIFVGNALREYRRHRTDENYLVLFERLHELFEEVQSVDDFLSQAQQGSTNPGNVSGLRQQISDLMFAILIAYGGRRASVNDALRSASGLLDALNDTVNTDISRLNAALSSASPANTEEAATSSNQE